MICQECEAVLARAERLVRAAREVLTDDCAGVNAGCRSVDELQAALVPFAAVEEEPAP